MSFWTQLKISESHSSKLQALEIPLLPSQPSRNPERTGRAFPSAIAELTPESHGK